jgi:hypothetical protein
MNFDQKELFTAREACAVLRISPVTLWRERKAGRISFRRVASRVVFTGRDLEEYLERNKREALS